MLQAIAVLTLGLAGISPPTPAEATPPAAEWPQFRGGPTRVASDVASTITPANVSALDRAWHADLGIVVSSPAVVGGVVYVGAYGAAAGAGAGVSPGLYAFPTTCASTGSCTPLWTAPTAASMTSSPAVVGGTVYTGTLDGKVYAFDAGGVQGCSGSPKTCAALWTGDAGGALESSPVVAGGRVYIAADNDRMSVFDAGGVTNCSGVPKTCTPLWTASLGGPSEITSTPAVSGGVLFVSSNQTLYAFDAAGVTNCAGSPGVCQPLWTAANAASDVSPTVANGVVYSGGNGSLQAFDVAGVTNCSGVPKTCAPLWTAATGLLASSPAVANGVAYVGGFDRKLYAFDAAGATNCSGAPKTCTPLWTALTSTINSALLISTPAVANGLVFTATGIGDHHLLAYDGAGVTNCSGIPKVCQPVWTGDTGISVRSSPALAGGDVYVGTDGDGLLAFGLPASGAGAFHPLPPARIYDSRFGAGALAPGETRAIPVAGLGGVPATGASSVVLNVTVTEPTAGGWLTVFPSGSPAPLASNVNFTAGQTVPNAVVAKVGPDGAVDVYNAAGTTHVVIDVEGWFGEAGPPAGVRYTPLDPARILDTRATAPIGPGATLSLPVAGQGGVPAGEATAVVLNVTVTEPTAGGWLTVFPTGVPQPYASNLNFVPGQTVANKVVVPLGAGGQVDIFNSTGTTHIVVDVEGWFGSGGPAPGAPYQPLAPSRLVDTRASAPIAPDSTLAVTVTGVGGVPATGVTAVLLNVTVTEPTAGGWLTVSPTGTPRPLASSVNFGPGQTVANAVVAKVGAGGRVDVYNATGSTHVVVDVQGWFGS